METRYYKVAGHVFCVCAEAVDMALLTNYEPFATTETDVLFRLEVTDGAAVSFSEEMRQDDEGQEIVCGHTLEGDSVFEFRWWQQTAGFLVCAPDYGRARIVMTGQHRKMAIDNALMVLYALTTASRQTALFHAAVVSHEGRAYMFLGKSGTGKSTHARLWLHAIAGTALVNDDNPVVRYDDKQGAVVYGSPWSGKTPCYRNVSYPIGGIVLLSQAPYNKIRRMRGIEAYAALVPSISGKRWEPAIAEGLHKTENLLVGHVPTYHLECLPDDEAALLCHQTIAP